MVATAPGEKLLRRPRTISSLFCAESNLVLRKINKNCCHAPELCCLTPICTKSFVGWGFATGFTGGVHSTPPGPLAVFRGPTSKGRGRQGEGGSSSFARGRKKEKTAPMHAPLLCLLWCTQSIVLRCERMVHLWLGDNLNAFYYRAMLCIRGTSHRDFEFGTLTYHSKSHPANGKSSLKGAWSGSNNPF